MEIEASPRPNHTRQMRPQPSPMPDVRQAGQAQGHPQPPGPDHRLQAGRLPRHHLRRVPGPVRLLHDLPHHSAGRRAQGPVRQQGPPGRPRPHPRRRHERRAGHRLDAAGLSPRPLRRLRLRLPRPTGPGGSTWPTIAAGSWTASAARCASTSCTWAATPCCWPPTRSRTCRWPSPWSPATTRTTCGGS